MTLVVSEVWYRGITMVGDSAVTVRRATGGVETRNGAAKVHYAENVNVGFAIWGRACVGDEPMDAWLQRFIAKRIDDHDTLESVCEKLAAGLNADLTKTGKSWSNLRRGIHVAGYVDDLPNLFHIHTGPDGAPQHELRVFRDVSPSTLELDARSYKLALFAGSYNLVNGYHEMYVPLFKTILENYLTILPKFGFKFPMGSLEHRVSLFKMLIQFVGETLKADERPQSVGEPFQAIAFTQHGLKIDQRLAVSPGVHTCGDLADVIA